MEQVASDMHSNIYCYNKIPAVPNIDFGSTMNLTRIKQVLELKEWNFNRNYKIFLLLKHYYNNQSSHQGSGCENCILPIAHLELSIPFLDRDHFNKKKSAKILF